MVNLKNTLSLTLDRFTKNMSASVDEFKRQRKKYNIIEIYRIIMAIYRKKSRNLESKNKTKNWLFLTGRNPEARNATLIIAIQELIRRINLVKLWWKQIQNSQTSYADESNNRLLRERRILAQKKCMCMHDSECKMDHWDVKWMCFPENENVVAHELVALIVNGIYRIFWIFAMKTVHMQIKEEYQIYSLRLSHFGH